MISNFLNPILLRICIEKFNHQMHILIRISAQKLPRRRLEGVGATVFYVAVQRVRSRLQYQVEYFDYSKVPNKRGVQITVLVGFFLF